MRVPRTNDAAKMLEEFRELLAISGGDQFKVRAYEKAARAVAGHPADIAGLNEKGLDFIPNVGSHLTRKIVEFRATGSVEELDELRERVPAGLRTLLTAPAEADADALSAVMIAHTRPGLVGLSWRWEPRRALS